MNYLLVPACVDVHCCSVCKMFIRDVQEEIDVLKDALRDIATSKYCMYGHTESGNSYGIGVTDGHRYCAEIARKALDGVVKG